MSTIFVTITGDKRIVKKIGKTEAKIKNPRSMLRTIGKKLEKYFKANMDSEGVKLLKKRWQDLSPASQAAKSRLGFGSKRILERTGKLKRGIKTLTVTRDTLTVGNRVKYYPFHQLGGKKMPRRQQLGVNPEVTKIVVDEIRKQIKFK